MKLKSFAIGAVPALAVAALLAPVAQATPIPIPYTDGDLFMGFRTPTGTQSYLINIGSASYYQSLAAGVYNITTLKGLGNVDADLDATFGTDTWDDTGSTLLWGVVGKYDLLVSDFNVLFAAKAETTLGTVVTGWARRAESPQGTQVSKITNLASGALNDFEGVTANNPRGIISNNTDTNDWSEFMAGNGGSTGSQTSSNAAFAVWTSSQFEGSFVSGGAAGTRLDLFEMIPGSGAGTYLGTFSIDSNANINFTVPVAAPEPSSVALLSLSGCVLGFVRRRKAVLA